MDISHRRIELQAPEDFSYLINNVRRAAADSINAAFPPVPEGDDAQEDELRVRIEQMVDEYITKTFTLAAPNISINGLPVDPTRFLSSSNPTASATLLPEEQYEPFDARKRARVEELAREEEDLLRSIASLKRRVPAATANSWAGATKNAILEDEKMLDAAKERVIADLTGQGQSGGTQQQETTEGEGEEENAPGGINKNNKKKKRVLLEDIGPLPLERQENVEEEYKDAVETLGRLKRDMPATVAKMERARVAGGYVVTGR
ncbi:putative kinetochore protein [Naviculisporaceae sp. PSN 640]